MKLEFTEKDCLEWAVAEIIDPEPIQAALKTGKQLRVKLGIDPTSPNIHLGRSIALWRLRAFQELGHKIDLIIGDFTGQVGDTSDKDSERPMLTEQTIQDNLSHYLEQLWMILNPEKKELVEIHYNSTWLAPLSFAQISTMADVFSVNSFIKRELVAKRLEEGSRVSLREMLYPLMQGYDSVMLKTDIELGGTDQRFNLLAGRLLQERAGQHPQSLIMHILIDGTDGRKMSSSWGNVISLRDTPEDKFGKLMTVHDQIMPQYLSVLPSSVFPFSKAELKERMAAGENPRDLKMQLAEVLVTLYHGEEKAREVREAFIAQFTDNKLPEDIPVLSLKTVPQSGNWLDILDVLVFSQIASSKSDARRLLEQGGVKIDQKVITDLNFQIKPGVILQVGKRRFLKIEE